ncbi:MAG: helix-turn-helix transcriptional regulator [Bacteroidetes bacterium]|nr:helix-turn-helix transcriptional regulator [Bacteroidota bacterium]
MSQLGKKLREIRERKKLLLRQVAAYLECDTAMISKVEHGERFLGKEQIEKLAKYYEVEADTLLTLWYADKVLSIVGDDPLGKKGVKKALNELTD